MTFFSLFCMYTIRVCISTAITEMALPTTENKVSTDDTCPSDDLSHKSNTSATDYGIGKYNWNEELQVPTWKLLAKMRKKASRVFGEFSFLKIKLWYAFHNWICCDYMAMPSLLFRLITLMCHLIKLLIW